MLEDKIINSALWAAYGDSLGFITEFVPNEDKLLNRVPDSEPFYPQAWSKKIGGLYGSYIKLPQGCYSDDTQLRLAVSRSIAGNGSFRIDAFASIELPVWRSYALGGGVGSKLAAENLTKNSSRWFSNFFKKDKRSYFQSGGNGAAMRIQPHVWAATNKSHPDTFLRDVVFDSIITHGHPRGFLGAAFHAMTLAMTLLRSKPIGPEDWKSCIEFLSRVPFLLRDKMETKEQWIPIWEKEFGNSIEQAVDDVQKEFDTYIDNFENLDAENPTEIYNKIAETIEAKNSPYVGSGTKTSFLAAVAAFLFQEETPAAALSIVAKCYGTDTDTIGTMAGALIGAYSSESPNSKLIMDVDYISKEAKRLSDISLQKCSKTFLYPSLLSWSSPKTLLDMVGQSENTPLVVGLGKINFSSNQSNEKGYLWGELEFGQSLLVKTRNVLPQYPSTIIAGYKDVTTMQREDFPSSKKQKKVKQIQQNLLTQEKKTQKAAVEDLDLIYAMLKGVAESGLSERKIGQDLLDLLKHKNNAALMRSYVTILAEMLSKD